MKCTMKRTVTLLLCLILLAGLLCPSARGAGGEAAAAADRLSALGLLAGTGTGEDASYDLDRAPTRNEAVTMLVRFLGREAEATSGTWDTPFTDLGWAEDCIGFAYANGLAKGVSATAFGGDRTVSAS